MLEKVFSLFLCIISVITFYLAGKFDLSFVGTDGLGPDVFPKIISVILFLLGATMFWQKTKEEKKDEKYNKNIKYGLMMIGVFGVYIFLINKIGYLTSTVLFSFIGISILKKDGLVLKIVYSIIFPVGLYLLFTHVFNVSLPTGILI